MKPSSIIWTIVAIIVVVGGIYLLTDHHSSTPTQTEAVQTSAAPAATLALSSNTQFTNYLTAPNGMTLYTDTNDTAGVSNCTGDCPTAWPPYTVTDASNLTLGANMGGTIGTITRSDGTMQVTYNGMPLYFWAQDTNPGDTTGDGKNGFTIALMATTTTETQAQSNTTAPAVQTQTTVQTSVPAPTTAPSYNY